MVREIYPTVPEVLADICAPIVPGLDGVPGEADYFVEQFTAWLNSVGQSTSMAGYFTESDIPALVKMTMESSLSKILLGVDEKVIERIFIERGARAPFLRGWVKGT